MTFCRAPLCLPAGVTGPAVPVEQGIFRSCSVGELRNDCHFQFTVPVLHFPEEARQFAEWNFTRYKV